MSDVAKKRDAVVGRILAFVDSEVKKLQAASRNRGTKPITSETMNHAGVGMLTDLCKAAAVLIKSDQPQRSLKDGALGRAAELLSDEELDRELSWQREKETSN